MKTPTQNSKSELQSRPEQLSTGKKQTTKTTDQKAERPQIDYKRRRENRLLKTEDLLSLLRAQAPEFYELAEVVGNWVWIQFQDRQPSSITRQLAEFGFHWNNTRRAWQHPCGTRRARPASYDPREKYGSRFAADMKAA